MNIFVAASYSSKVNYETGEVIPEYKEWLEDILDTIISLGHTVFCALRQDEYKINNADPASAFALDLEHLKKADLLIALLNDQTSAGVQTEIGMAIGDDKKVLFAHLPDDELSWFNKAIVLAGAATEILLPLTAESLQAQISDEK